LIDHFVVSKKNRLFCYVAFTAPSSQWRNVIVHNGKVINVKTKPAVTTGRVTWYKAQTPSPRHTSSQVWTALPFQRDVIYRRPQKRVGSDELQG